MLIGQSPEIMKTKRVIRQIAKTNDNALIIGEFGSGRKFSAHEIHKRSKQKNRPFVVVNCTAVGDTVSDGDLFGAFHEGEKGVERTVGIFEQAKKGILYLENVDELRPEYQQRFMNIFKEGKFKKLGEDKYIEADFRIFASATSEKNLTADKFRPDLLNFIDKFKLYIPALRNRKQDIPGLFATFLQEYCDELNNELPPVPSEIFESLMEYEWRGNIYELKNTVRNLVLMSPDGQLSVEYLPFEIKKHPFEFLGESDLPDAVGEVEKYLIKKSLRRFAGNQSKAAKILNVSEAALRYKMKKYGLSRKSF